jgi:hypothetical protein
MRDRRYPVKDENQLPVRPGREDLIEVADAR